MASSRIHPLHVMAELFLHCFALGPLPSNLAPARTVHDQHIFSRLPSFPGLRRCHGPGKQDNACCEAAVQPVRSFI